MAARFGSLSVGLPAAVLSTLVLLSAAGFATASTAASPHASAVAPAAIGTAGIPGPSACAGPLNYTLTPMFRNGSAPLTVSFHSTLSGGCAPYQVAWQFGDGSSANGINVTHVFRSAGLFYVLAQAKDNSTLTANATGTINVTGGSGVVTVRVTALPSNGTAPLPIIAWANVTGGNLSDDVILSWTFGDGGTGTGSPVRHTYSSPGVFSLRAAAVLEGSVKGTGGTNVTVAPGTSPGQANLSVLATPTNVTVPANVTAFVFSNGVGSPYRLQVCFGDGTICATGPTGWSGSPTAVLFHQYLAAGHFTVEATILDTSGQLLAVASATVEAETGPTLGVTAYATPNGDTAPSTTTFLATPTGGTPPYSVQWIFGDGTDGSSLPGLAITHTYEDGGTFTPTVSVRDAVGGVVNVTLAALFVHTATETTGIPSVTLGLPTGVVLAILLLAAVVVGLAVGRWSRRRARNRLLRKEGEELVRELERR